MSSTRARALAGHGPLPRRRRRPGHPSGRDVRGSRRRWPRPWSGPHTSGRTEQMYSNSLPDGAARWLATQTEVDLLAAAGLKVVRMRYAELVTEPERTITEALTRLGAAVPAGGFEHLGHTIEGAQVQLAPSHGLSGNPSRFQRRGRAAPDEGLAGPSDLWDSSGSSGPSPSPRCSGTVPPPSGARRRDAGASDHDRCRPATLQSRMWPPGRRSWSLMATRGRPPSWPPRCSVGGRPGLPRSHRRPGRP